MEDGEAEATIDLGPHHTNNRGVAHGGVVSSLLDTAMGAAVISSIPKEWWCATTGLHDPVHRRRAGGTAHRDRDRSSRRGRCVAFVQGEAHDENGRSVATAQGTWHLWPYKPGTEQLERRGRTSSSRDRESACASGRSSPSGATTPATTRRWGTRSPFRPSSSSSRPSALVHDGGVVTLPVGLGQVHHEVELVVVIGRAGRAIPEAAALDHVFGYAVGIDLTLRDLQNEAKSKGEPWDLCERVRRIRTGFKRRPERKRRRRLGVGLVLGRERRSPPGR